MEEVGEKSPAQWAIDMFEGKNYQYERRFYNKYTGEIFCGIVGLTSPWLRNYTLHRPLYAGLQYHIAFGIVGVAIGRILTVKTDQYYAKRDAMLLDYVKKHPQRFPEPLLIGFINVVVLANSGDTYALPLQFRWRTWGLGWLLFTLGNKKYADLLLPWIPIR